MSSYINIGVKGMKFAYKLAMKLLLIGVVIFAIVLLLVIVGIQNPLVMVLAASATHSIICILVVKYDGKR